MGFVRISKIKPLEDYELKNETEIFKTIKYNN
jgi:hypothetical protein